MAIEAPTRGEGDLTSFHDARADRQVDDKRIFLSHAHADRALADLLHNSLVLGGVPEGRIFYSSSRATGIPSGEEVHSYLRRSLLVAGLVIELVSETFLTRPVCLMELGGAWTLGTPTCPIVVPPLTRDRAQQQIGTVQMGFLGTGDDIDDLFDELHDRLAKDVGIVTPTTPWNRAIRGFKLQLASVLTRAAPSTPTPQQGSRRDVTSAGNTARIPDPSRLVVQSSKEIALSNVSYAPSGLEIFGEVTNVDSVEHGVVIDATFYNTEKAIVGVRTDAVFQLQPGATKTFKIDRLPDHDHCKVGIQTMVGV